MRNLSKLVLAATLAAGTSALAVSAPAAAQKEEKKPGFKLSKPVQAIAGNAQTAIANKDFATAETLVGQMETSGTTDDDKYVAAALRYDLENNKLAAQQAANPNAPLNQTSLAKPLEALIAAKNTPAADRGKYAYRRGLLAANGGQYKVATQFFTQAQQLGFTDPDLPLQLVKVKIQGGDAASGLTDLNADIDKRKAAGQQVPEDYYRLGIATAAKAKLNPQTQDWMLKYVAAYPTAKNWRDVVFIYGLNPQAMITPDKTQKIDLFRLLRYTNSLADQNDYAELAQDLNDRGLPEEALAVIKEGTAKGKIPAGSAMARDITASSTRAIKLEGPLSGSETKAKSAATGDLAYQTADAYLGSANYPKAVELYQLALQKGGPKVNADEINTRLGIAQAGMGDKAAAAASFAKVTSQPRAGIAKFWTAAVQAPATGTVPAAAPAPAAAAAPSN